MQRISIIGLGNIGSNVAQSLLQSNLAITLYNRTKSKAEPHIINGATVKDSVSSALTNADIIISCLFDDESMLEVFSKEHIASMPKGAIHASTATITPSTAKILEQRHNELGVKYISANVLGSGETALDKTMITFVSGNQDAVSAITPIFELFSRDIYNFG